MVKKNAVADIEWPLRGTAVFSDSEGSPAEPPSRFKLIKFLAINVILSLVDFALDWATVHDAWILTKNPPSGGMYGGVFSRSYFTVSGAAFSALWGTGFQIYQARAWWKSYKRGRSGEFFGIDGIRGGLIGMLADHENLSNSKTCNMYRCQMLLHVFLEQGTQFIVSWFIACDGGLTPLSALKMVACAFSVAHGTAIVGLRVWCCSCWFHDKHFSDRRWFKAGIYIMTAMNYYIMVFMVLMAVDGSSTYHLTLSVVSSMAHPCAPVVPFRPSASYLDAFGPSWLYSESASPEITYHTQDNSTYQPWWHSIAFNVSNCTSKYLDSSGNAPVTLTEPQAVSVVEPYSIEVTVPLSREYLGMRFNGSNGPLIDRPDNLKPCRPFGAHTHDVPLCFPRTPAAALRYMFTEPINFAHVAWGQMLRIYPCPNPDSFERGSGRYCPSWRGNFRSFPYTEYVIRASEDWTLWNQSNNFTRSYIYLLTKEDWSLI